MSITHTEHLLFLQKRYPSFISVLIKTCVAAMLLFNLSQKITYMGKMKTAIYEEHELNILSSQKTHNLHHI